MKKEIFKFTKEYTQEISHSLVNSAARYLHPLEIETTMKEDIQMINLTYAMSLITA
jgi:hypothetical protein